MIKDSKIYLIFILSLFFLNQGNSLIAYPLSNAVSSSLYKHDVFSPFSLLKEVGQENNENSLSFFSYRPNQTQFKTHVYFAFIFFFFILIIIKLSSPEYFPDLFSKLFKKNYLISRAPKSKFNLSINSIFLDFIFITVLSYFFFQYLYPSFKIEYYLILGGLIGFILFQIIIITLFYNIFFGTGNFNIHLANIIVSNRIIGILFTPLLFFITYLDQNYQHLCLNILLIIIVFIILLRIYRILNQIKILHNYSFLFIIIYICAFELSVYLVCFKIVLLFINS